MKDKYKETSRGGLGHRRRRGAAGRERQPSECYNMKALVKSKVERGCGSPCPAARHQRRAHPRPRTGICGTDLHIYAGRVGGQPSLCPSWSATSSWARSSSRIQRGRLPARADRQRRGTCAARCRNWLAGRRHLLRGHAGRRRQPRGRLRRIHRPAHEQRLGARGRDRRKTWLRSSIPSATPYTARPSPSSAKTLVPGPAPSASWRRWWRAPRRGAPRRDHGPEPLPAGARGKMESPRRRSARDEPADVQKKLDVGGVRRRHGDVRQRPGLPRHAREHGPWRQDRHVGDPRARDGHRLEHRHLQHADHQGHLRPRDVRDLVQDDGHAPMRARHQARDHAPVPLRGLRARFRGDGQRELRACPPQLE